MPKADWIYWCDHCSKGTHDYPKYLLHMLKAHDIDLQAQEKESRHA